MSRTIRRQHDFARGLILAEEARANLPIATYLFLLDQAARTGYLPVVDENGRPVKDESGAPIADKLEARERMDIAKYLINKTLPDVPKEVYHTVTANQQVQDVELEKLPNLSTDALRAIAAGQVVDAEFTGGAPQP